ncbi:hypothetical protein DDZ14_16855 [Maritimibacter sp. 55A14]|nr:hypothetical protein DDZ14_16855 [Maritimibacter sp. 55A14]
MAPAGNGGAVPCGRDARLARALARGDLAAHLRARHVHVEGRLNPTRAVRLLWGKLQLLMVVVLLLTGRLESLRTASIVTAFPSMLLIIIIAVSLYRDLAQEIVARDEKARLLDMRIERLLLRESERDAAEKAGAEIHPTVPEEGAPTEPSGGDDDRPAE